MTFHDPLFGQCGVTHVFRKDSFSEIHKSGGGVGVVGGVLNEVLWNRQNGKNEIRRTSSLPMVKGFGACPG